MASGPGRHDSLESSRGTSTLITLHGPRRRGRATRLALAVVSVAVLLSGCTPTASDSSSATSPSGDTAPDPVASELRAMVDDGTVVVVEDGQRLVIAEVAADEELLLATVRPEVAEPVTVLVLVRGASGYELRYVNVSDGQATDLYGFPWRLQITDAVVPVLDVPPLPVWAPDGSAIAWLEWDADGTILRTVGWVDHELGANPSDDQAAFRLDEVPAGTQLEAWEQDEDGLALLVTRRDREPVWHLRLEDGEPTVTESTQAVG